MPRPLIMPLLIGLAGVAVLVALGVWQVQRLDWKQGVLAEIGAKVHGTPGALPDAVDAARHAYLPVAAEGRIGVPEILVQSSMKLVGPGYRVIAPFETGGRRILLDRGFIRLSDRDALRAEVAATVTGNLHWPDETDMFTPDPDPDARLWFARDVVGMAAALGTEPVLLVVRATDEAPLAVTPLPLDTAGIPNNHLQYAITWFLLAAVWAAMSVYLGLSQHRAAKEGARP